VLVHEFKHFHQSKNKWVVQVHNFVQKDKKMAEKVQILDILNQDTLKKFWITKCNKGKIIPESKHMTLESLTCCSTLHEIGWPFWRLKHAVDDLCFHVMIHTQKRVVLDGLLHLTNMNNINGMALELKFQIIIEDLSEASTLMITGAKLCYSSSCLIGK
jgi:hypothetical protein